jgi:Mn-dependent DtxR family transcriptional regulator
MIKANRLETIVIELHIDYQTAQRLKAMMQNPHRNEPPDISRLREEMFVALTNAGVAL